MARSVTAIIRVTNRCNLRCHYCYAAKSQTDMSEPAASILLGRLACFVGTGGSVKCIWHGGEPLLRPMEFYEFIIACQNALTGVHWTNGIQSNGTLLSSKDLDFLSANQVGLGISIDGPRNTHTANRPMQNGMSSFDLSMRGMRLGADRNTKQQGQLFGAICTVTSDMSERPEEIYGFFRMLPVRLKLHPAVTLNSALRPSPAQYSRFLRRFCELWLSDASAALVVTTFEEALCVAAGWNSRECTWSSNCQSRMIAIDVDGSVYPCSRAVGNNLLRYGNVLSSELSDILRAEARQAFLLRKPDKCQKCQYLPWCNAGCPMNALELTGKLNVPDPFCAAHKALFAVAAKAVSESQKGENHNIRECTRSARAEIGPVVQ